MRFIHLADVHLGAVPDRGCPWSEKREEEIWETFRRVIAGIRENPVDLLFIAGDLFHRQPLLRELKEVNNLFSTIPDTRVYLMAGNHDYIKADSFYRDFQWEKNVTFFKNEQPTCVKDEKLDVYVYGLSYEHQEIENPLYDSIHPAEGEGVNSPHRLRYFAVDLGWLSSTFTVNLPSKMSFSRALTLATMSAGIFFSKVPSGAREEPLCFIMEYGP